MRSGEIRALTGLRIVAALWVVLFHFRPLLWQAAPDFASALSPILDCGAQGVDLFFILSGFVLTWNYIDKMGKSWSTRATLRFLWLRLARVWPVYLVTMHLAALWIIFTLNVGHVPSENVWTLNAISYIRQLFLVQLWFQPFFDGSSWDGPAWSISAEWLAYLVFGLLILVVFRVARATRARSLLWLAFAASLPPMLLLLASGHLYTPWSWLPRIVLQFIAGALACAAVRRLRPSDRTRTGAGYLSVLLVAVMVGALYLISAHPVPTVFDGSGLVDVLFVPLVITMSIGTGTLPALLSTQGRGVPRSDLVQPLHGPRVGAHHLDLDGATVRAGFGGHRRGQADGRRADRARVARCGGAVPRRRGACSTLDAQDGRRQGGIARVKGEPGTRDGQGGADRRIGPRGMTRRFDR